ncbi:MAG TPA: hypothetical protein VLM79_32750 [Kofleriaceae bacterium]|nr:hypothetical protein [Kofleriaceae bacterium]
MWIWSLRPSRAFAIAVASGLGACQGIETAEPPEPAVSSLSAAVNVDDKCDWEQWGGNPAHTGQGCKEVDHMDRISAHMTFDPFLEQELADAVIQKGNGALFTHFQSPLLVDDHVYMEFKAGTYTSCDSVPEGAPCGSLAWNSQVWTERAFHWEHGTLVADWTFESDWKPEPGTFVSWEPVFHAVVVGNLIYVPGASGSVHKLDRRTGRKLATIRLPGVGTDPNTFVAGGLAADKRGNVYYNALALEATAPRATNPRGAWLVKVRPDNSVAMASFSTIAVGAPAPTDLCVAQFSFDQLPWPPSPDAVAPSFPCGAQRPGLNVTPAIGDDGTVVTVSTAHFNQSYSHVIAVHADLTPKWTASLRGLLDDGCGVRVASDATPETTDPFILRFHCRAGANVGVDPATNLPPAGLVNDQGSSSPVILPDGGVLYGAFTSYNQFRGHLFKLDKHGRPAGTYDFGWDVTPAVYRHDGTYSIITKDNLYFDQQFYMTQLDSELRPEWTFKGTETQSCQRAPDGTVSCVDDGQHPTGFEWCVNAPAVDREGNVYANSEDGWVYKIGQGGQLVDRTFLLLTLGAAYTPISIDQRGRLYSLNGGDLFVLGKHGGHDHE